MLAVPCPGFLQAGCVLYPGCDHCLRAVRTTPDRTGDGADAVELSPFMCDRMPAIARGDGAADGVDLCPGSACHVEPPGQHAQAMLVHRGDPYVTEHLDHAPLSRDEVQDRVEARLSGQAPVPGWFMRGVAIFVDDRLIGDATLRVQPGPEGRSWQPWIGYALRPKVGGRGPFVGMYGRSSMAGLSCRDPAESSGRVGQEALVASVLAQED